MTMTHFSVFEILDLDCAEQVAELFVSDEGTITLRAGPDLQSAHRLVAAVDNLRIASSLDLRSESIVDGAFVMTALKVSRGEPLYAAAVCDMLSCRFGFRCVEWDSIDATA